MKNITGLAVVLSLLAGMVGAGNCAETGAVAPAVKPVVKRAMTSAAQPAPATVAVSTATVKAAAKKTKTAKPRSVPRSGSGKTKLSLPDKHLSVAPSTTTTAVPASK